MKKFKKSNTSIYICIVLFGIVGIYLTFIAGNINNYNSQTTAYRIYPNERYDSEGSITYQPIYYYQVNGREYECKSKVGSSSYPSEDKNIVYYDEADPTKCLTEYEKSSNKLAGIICLVVTGVLIYFFIIKKPVSVEETNNQIRIENSEKVIETINKIQLIYKRIILGIIIIIVLVLTLIDTVIFKQTIKARNYIETTAVFVRENEDYDSDVFSECVYSFTDKNGIEYEITEVVSSGNGIDDTIKIKYDEDNPQEYYSDGATLDKKGMIWYIVKIVILILLIVLFFNKKLLSKIGISLTNRR